MNVPHVHQKQEAEGRRNRAAQKSKNRCGLIIHYVVDRPWRNNMNNTNNNNK